MIAMLVLVLATATAIVPHIADCLLALCFHVLR